LLTINNSILKSLIKTAKILFTSKNRVNIEIIIVNALIINLIKPKKMRLYYQLITGIIIKCISTPIITGEPGGKKASVVDGYVTMNHETEHVSNITFMLNDVICSWEDVS
jgi:hypothetical protein